MDHSPGSMPHCLQARRTTEVDEMILVAFDTPAGQPVTATVNEELFKRGMAQQLTLYVGDNAFALQLGAAEAKHLHGALDSFLSCMSDSGHFS